MIMSVFSYLFCFVFVIVFVIVIVFAYIYNKVLQLLHVAFLSYEYLPDVVVSGEDSCDVAFACRQWLGGKVSVCAGAYHEVA